MTAPSRASLDDIRRHYPAAPNPTLIPNGVDIRPFGRVTATAVAAARDRYQLPEKFILAVGAHRPHKNHEVLVQAMAAVPGDVGLVIVGSPDPSFRDPLPGLIAELGLESRVKLVPDVADEWLPAVYRAASVFAFPSLAEGYGLPVLEAMAAGVPVVMSDIRVMAEVAGSAAVMVPPRDVAGWASALTAVLCDAALADRLTAGRSRRRGGRQLGTRSLGPEQPAVRRGHRAPDSVRADRTQLRVAGRVRGRLLGYRAEGTAMPTPVMIEARGLVKSFRSAQALAGLDLTVPAGTTMCLLGPNGAGKTTAVRVLSTLLRPDAGWARVAGHDVVAEGAAVRRRIGLSGQYASVDDCLTGRANLVMIGRLRRLARREARRRAADLLATLDLERAADRPVRTYSGGMRRRLDLAASLLGQPSVLFLDEPTTGLDPQSRLTLWGIIGELVGAGTTLLLTTQYLDEADRLADRICVIDGGRVTAEGSPAELKSRVGTSHLRLTVPATVSLTRVAEEISGYAAGPVRRLAGHRGLDIPVVPRPGLVTEIVRVLDAAGIDVDDIAVRQPSLDDVFASLTGPVAA